MLTEKEKREMAQDAGWAAEYRIDGIKKSIRESPYDNDEEKAIMRKMIKFMYDELNRISLGDYSGNPVVQEFLKYNADIESIKASHSLGGDSFGV